ncbi:RCC1/BLIP-II [Setomelanomma holmii]|uniref:RCC1/BLIP-II n=1 Tax=Setomelanomma holmii TaxID=210430 RepID=A0A9P4HAS2_9PLEO|nr:RCC1/BLIP-II [Setomelanomma holmii]
MAESKTSLADLPLDILVDIWPYLDAKSFLSLCSTCKSFQQPSIRLDPAYWSFATRSTFRIPNQPVVQHDGVRWQNMYRRLLTQSRVFTWGNKSHSRLGHSYDERVHDMPMMPRVIRPRRIRMSTHCSFPTEMEDTRQLGVIADMQCGGWSTTLLTSKGSLHSVGVLDGGRVFAAIERLKPLGFPAGFPSSSAEAQYEEPSIAIRQFSSGRSHILAVSDTGRIWSWYHVQNPALHVRFANLDISEMSLSDEEKKATAYGRVKQVVAGWSRSSAYIVGVGIVVWDPVERDHDEEATDTMLVLEHAEVPSTGFQRVKDARSQSEEQKALGEHVGAVLNYIILEHFVVFATDTGKVFCGRFGEKNRVDNIIELRALRSGQGVPLDVQGSFRRFAVFKGKEVITSDQNYLDSLWTTQGNLSDEVNAAGLHKIPALQDNGVISVAFGDYHYLALHSNGTITSYGTELQACGALGLGDEHEDEGRARGIVYDRFTHDGRLLPHAYTHGRQVWFDHQRKDWINHLMKGGDDGEEANERIQLVRDQQHVQGEVSEWIEQEGRAWEAKHKGKDGLGAYFALGISAAGWHSGGLVLVNDELANQGYTDSLEAKSFPRLKLADGVEMPGTKAFDEWREGRPDWRLDLQI